MQAPESEGASIVMLGSFNPSIFQPRWLGVQGLIRQEEADNAKIMLINTEVADFATEWFQLQVLDQRLQLLTQDPRQYAPLRDLALGILQLLSHTPVSALGINRFLHFAMPSTETWHTFGHTVAPKNLWNPIMDNPGLRTMMIEGRRRESSTGILRVRVEPSGKVQPGIYIDVNEEFKPTDQDRIAEWVSELLIANWDSFIEFSWTASESLLQNVKA